MQNITDIIEAYLKQILNDETKVEIKRQEIAQRFDCVPSQINYVINTRFTVEKGYFVESKRGGGGYIRIQKIVLLDSHDLLDEMSAWVGDQLTEQAAEDYLIRLMNEQLLTRREAIIIQALLRKESLPMDVEDQHRMRAHLMQSLLQTIKRL
ncbi:MULTISPECIES: CtsR family transcriptional regulator [Exiguobacterium]|uniref:Transcriptional regulator CtsR n=1 Tax=Exiguobacterium oxidotolerans TaxID=223958 RepID=A0A653IGT0_9BACL|nr:MULTISPECIES: CtsR family transcriptional regulator [Exiguobacterium]ASI34100.1 CtsR family transcriptional regulator [Exiguobacterium sp. N4-1P]ASI37092.1 CtsR family transcriptional regulator [Exiguobacterium sp. N4-1P]VWX38486.1 transcriptional regulator of class III stress genes [Exiguobacterium oxidotolerans]